jgi:hypothetical protein
MSISWGKSERFKFGSCGALIHWSPPKIPALYAITYKQDPKNKPKNHTVLFFGQADDLSEQAPALNGEILDTWTNNGGEAGELFVFIHPMPGSTLRNRLTVHEQLVLEYRPDGNRY